REPSIETFMIVSRYFKPQEDAENHLLYQKVLERNYKALSGNYKKIYIKKLICSLNQNLKLDDIKIDTEKRLLTINSKNLVNMPYLQGANIKAIDLSHSSIIDISFCAPTKLYSLNLSHSTIKRFNSKAIFGTRDLDISFTTIKAFPRQIALVEYLDIANTPLNEYSRLVSLKKLRRLTIKKGQVPKEILSLLQCKIIEID
ncbi:MAG: hypothetical protein NE330_11695, partial [Lentisphaeraceae bacterium]|nr:hypothetical protein [Lentisphaeraceae bacterium]